MNELFVGFEEVMDYIDDLLLITKGTYEEHLEELDRVLKKLEKAGLKVNMNKSFFAQQELYYLGYWITQMPLAKKMHVEGQSRKIGPTNQTVFQEPAMEMDRHRAKTFEDIKETVAKNILLMLIYPDFNKPFEIHTDAIQYQLGATISQGGIPIAFLSMKCKFSTTELHHNRERVVGYCRNI
eukprot:15351189-Ditylum_brightwellii.AAC.1